MTYESEMAIKASYRLEAKKDGLKQVQSGDVKLTLTISANDMPTDLYSDPMGQRYVVAMVPVQDDETPRISPAQDEKKPKSYAGQAKMLAQDGDFQEFLHQEREYSPADTSHAEIYIEDYCGITTCADIIDGTAAGDLFKDLRAKYLSWKNTPPLEAYE